MSSVPRQLSLLSLPLEIRLLILRHTLHEEEIVIQYDWSTLRVTSNACGEVLRTCQQLRHEGTSILYGENALSISARNALTFIHHFLPSVGANNASMIQHIKFQVTSSHYAFMLSLPLSTIVQIQPNLGSLRRMTWEINESVLRQDPECPTVCEWYARLCRQQMPRLSQLVCSEDHRGYLSISIME